MNKSNFMCYYKKIEIIIILGFLYILSTTINKLSEYYGFNVVFS